MRFVLNLISIIFLIKYASSQNGDFESNQLVKYIVYKFLILRKKYFFSSERLKTAKLALSK